MIWEQSTELTFSNLLISVVLFPKTFYFLLKDLKLYYKLNNIFFYVRLKNLENWLTKFLFIDVYRYFN